MSTVDRVPLQDALLPKGRPPWRSFSAGAVLQIILLIAAISLPLLFPDRVKDFRNYVATVVAPSPETVSAWKPQPLRMRRIRSAETQQRPILPSTPAIPSLVISTPAIKPARATTSTDAPNIVSDSPAVLSLATTAAPNLQEPLPQVRTGEFGDGVSDKASTAGTPNVVRLGGFGSLSGGKGMTISSGSGDAKAVRQGLFGDAGRSSTTRKTRKRADTSSRSKPVEILLKPTPTYTTDALSKKIEGEVLLEVRFPASGEATVVRVVHGLGYGLDEAAEAAARRIQFRPAQDDAGLPIDSTAIVHIQFELAY